jgi:hypothetical protein
MKTSRFVLLLFFICISFTVKSQEHHTVKSSSRLDVGLEGMIGFSVGKNFYSMNVGGPSLFLVLNKDWKIGMGAFPSLYLLEGKLGARLGVSPKVEYKNLIFFAPFFYREKTEKWIWSVGLGYKFHRGKFGH